MATSGTTGTMPGQPAAGNTAPDAAPAVDAGDQDGYWSPYRRWRANDDSYWRDRKRFEDNEARFWESDDDDDDDDESWSRDSYNRRSRRVGFSWGARWWDRDPREA